ncbi:MAG: DPP IV N-terminal domain-containing protein [Polyangiaceae bacterium]
MIRRETMGAMGLVLAAFAGCSSTPQPACPGEKGPAPSAEAAKDAAPVRALPESASPVTFERMAVFPEPGWTVPRSVRFAPDGKSVVYLAAEGSGKDLSLFEYDLEKKTQRALVRAADVLSTDKPLSREEELRRERQRQRATGITSYLWAESAPVMVIPLGGDLYFRKADGKVSALTQTEEAELDPKICRNGEKVVFVRGRELFSIDTGSGREVALTSGAPEGVTHGQSDFNGQEEMDEPSGFWVSPSCSMVAYLEVDERKVATHTVLGYRGKKADQMEQRYPAAGGVNPSIRLGLLDLSTKKTRWVKVPGAGDGYLGRMEWSPDSDALYFQGLDRAQKKRTLYRADAKSGAVTELWSDSSPAWIEFGEMRVLEKSPALVWTAPREGHIHLETRDRATGKLLAQITRGDWDVTAIQAIDEKAGQVYFTATRESPLERHLYRAPIGGGEPVKLTGERGVHGTVVSVKSGVIYDLHSASDRPPAAVLRDAGGAVSGSIHTPNDAEIVSLRLRPKEMITVQGEGGVKLHGAMLKPRDMAPGARYPVVVIVYGGPGVQTVVDAWSPSLFWQHMADRGFVVFQLDNRGSTGRGPAFEHPIAGKLGQVEMRDQLAGIDHLKTLPFVDGGRIGIYGHSYGGYMAALALMTAPGVFKVGVAGSPVTEWQLYDTGYTERYMGSPAENAAGYEATDLTRMAKGLSGKLLLVHSMLDENVHFQHTADLIDALVTANKRFDLLVLPGERHGYRSPAARSYAFRRVASYLAENL